MPDAQVSLKSTLEWLCQAQDATDCGGFARAFSLIMGWELPYPETTGYIIPTLLDAAGQFPEFNLQERAQKAGHWLSKVQFTSGALCAKQYYQGNTRPSIFNTGMGIHGWVSLAESEGGECSLASATRAGVWIVQQQEDDGSWINGSYNGIPHTYYTMVDWALIRLFALTGDVRFRRAAVRNLNWTVQNQSPNGWFEHCSFTATEPVTTHTLSYTTQGLCESGRLLGEEKYLEAAHRGTKPLVDYFEMHQKLPGTFNDQWCPTSSWECLTGNAQTSIVWKTLALYLSDKRYKEHSAALNQRMLHCQRINSQLQGINGGIPGSWPISGEYDPLSFPNHAAKFHVDALKVVSAI